MKSILVIEDNPHMRSDIMEILEIGGYRVFGAETGEMGLDIVYKHNPDLVLCDVWMPGRNGFEVLERIRQDPMLDSMPFLFLTANAKADTLQQAKDLGATDYILKPFTIDELFAKVAQYLD